MKLNSKVNYTAVNEEGGIGAVPQSNKEQLVRAMATCLLWENTFYESGNEIADRIKKLARQVRIDDIISISKYVKDKMKIRHAPMYLMLQALSHPEKKKMGEWEKNKIACGISDVIERADELAEMLSMYWRDGKKPIPRQLKRGLARAFKKFDEYQLAKWNRDNEIKLRDVLFLCHAKAEGKEQDDLWKRLIEGKLSTPWTWEVELSAGKDKKKVFTELLKRKKLPYMALLRNLRNMSGVEPSLVEQAILSGAKNSKALPFRFITAANYAPSYVNCLSEAMTLAIDGNLPGETIILVDVSGSMDYSLSEKTEINRIDAASALAVLLNNCGERTRVFTFSKRLEEVPNYKGLALVNGIKNSQERSQTCLKYSLDQLEEVMKGRKARRLIVITDEQYQDYGKIKNKYEMAEMGYVLNVASNQVGIKLSGWWKRIDGFSERVVDWICFEEYKRLLDGEEMI